MNHPGIYDEIEILPVALLQQQRPLVNELRKLADSLKLDFGWHYLLDLVWIISRLGTVRGKRIIDAGAGTGVIQWYLAEKGAEVISVDRASRANLPLRFRQRFKVRGLRQSPIPDLNTPRQTVKNGLSGSPGGFATQAREITRSLSPQRATGAVVIYNQDLQNLADIADASVDTVVSVSALEHNPRENLPNVVKELGRVIKPGGALVATLGAARDLDWFHEPSSGWCYSEASLRRIFDLPASAPANYDRYDELFQSLRNCAELRDNLARFYFTSGNNGMPWGKWDPQYQPVGVCKLIR